jgi:hypothetical protein
MRGEGASQSKIAEATGVKYSTVLSILGSRIYLGEVQMNGEWFPGHHEAIITPETFAAADRGRVRGRARGTDLLSGRVRRGLCQRLMALDQNGQGTKLYRYHHRGQGCSQPRRTNIGLHRAAVLGLRLIGDDVELQAAIRRELDRAPPRSRHGVEDLVAQPRKLLRLYYDDKVGPTCLPRRRLACPWRSVKRSASPTMHALRWRAVTMLHSTSMPSHNCSQRSTSTRRGGPPRTSSGVC